MEEHHPEKTWPRKLRSWLIKVVFVLALGVIFVASVLFAARWVYNNIIHEQTDRGRCFVFDPHTCNSLTRTYIEQFTDQRIPDDATILSSGSFSGLKSDGSWALVRFNADHPFEPTPALAPLTTGYRRPHTLPQATLEELGFVGAPHVVQAKRASQDYLQVYVGKDAGGNQLVYFSFSRNL